MQGICTLPQSDVLLRGRNIPRPLKALLRDAQALVGTVCIQSLLRVGYVWMQELDLQ